MLKLLVCEQRLDEPVLCRNSSEMTMRDLARLEPSE